MPERLEISESFDPIAALLRLRALSAPARPGLLAQLDRFEVMSVLGSGRTGIVLLARDPRDGARVAVKLLRPELVSDSGARHRFAVAARHMQALAHPGTVPVLEFVDRPEGPYIVMPFFPGGSLAERLAESRPLDKGFARRVIDRVAAALQHAHGKGLLHGALTPANILLTADGEAVVSDLGMSAPAPTSGVAEAPADCGVEIAPHLSPAVARGEAEDTRRDIYACGAILYHMLTGQPPYRGETLAAVLEQVRAGPPPPILELNPAADRALARIAQRAMARELRDRYADMGEMGEDLARLGRGKLDALAGTRHTRRRVAATGAAALLFVLLGLLARRSPQHASFPASPPVFSPPFSTSYGQPIIFDRLTPVPNMSVELTVPGDGYDVHIVLETSDEPGASVVGSRIETATREGTVEFAVERVDRRQGAAGVVVSRTTIGPVEECAIPLPLRFATDRDVPPGEYQYRLLARTPASVVTAANVRLSATLRRGSY